MFHDLDFVSSNVEIINFSLGQKQTVLLMCCWQGQLFQNYPKSFYDHEAIKGFLFFLENGKLKMDLGSMTHFQIFP